MDAKQVDAFLRENEFYPCISARFEGVMLPTVYENNMFIKVQLAHEKQSFVVSFNTHIFGEWSYNPLHWSHMEGDGDAFHMAIRRAEYLKRATERAIKRLES